MDYVLLGGLLFVLFGVILFVMLPYIWYKQNFKYRGIIIKENGTLQNIRVMLSKDPISDITMNIIYATAFKDAYKFLIYKLFKKIEINTIPFEFYPSTELWFFVMKKSGELRQIEFKTLTDEIKFVEGDIGLYKAKYTSNQKTILATYTQPNLLDKVFGVLLIVVFFIGVIVMFSSASETAKNITEKGAQTSLELSTKIEKALNGSYSVEYCKEIWYLMEEIKKNETKKDIFVLK